MYMMNGWMSGKRSWIIIRRSGLSDDGLDTKYLGMKEKESSCFKGALQLYKEMR